jgi:mutator protein MutT
MSNLPHKRIGVAVIWNDEGKILIDKRKSTGAMGGLWEFPGGKIEPDETVSECIEREIREELGIEIRVGEELTTIEHTYDTFKVTLFVYHCYHRSGIPQPLECEEIRWVLVEELSEYTFPAANVAIIKLLLVDTPPTD